MSSTFFGLSIAGSGLRAANAALNTTANNVSNASTEGYSRQQVQTSANTPMRVFETYGCAGAGVDTLAIERIRDEFYDTKYRVNETKLGEVDTKAYYMRMIEDYMTDDGTTGFTSCFNKIFDALEEITKNASSDSTKAQFVSTLNTLTDYFNNMYGDIQDLQADVNDEIKIQCDKINSLAEELATVNKQINVIEMTGAKANDLRDKRDLLIDELSGIVDVDVIENPIYDKNGNETGAHRCIIRIAGGQTLVDQNEYNQLTCIARETYEKVNLNDIDGLYDIMWNTGLEFSLKNASMGGQLAGLIQMRDGNNNEYFSGKATNIVYKEDISTVTIKTSDAYLADMSKCNLSDFGGVITIGNQEYYYTDWEYKGNGEYKFTIDNLRSDQPLKISKKGLEANIGYAVNYQGVPYYMAQMNEWVRTFSAKMNEIFTQGYDAEGNEAGYVFTGEMPTDAKQYSEDILLNQDILNPHGKGYYYINAGNFSVVEALVKDASILGTRQDPTRGVEECEMVKAVLNMFDDKNQFEFRGRKAGGYLDCILSDVALNANEANTLYSTYSSLENTISNQRLSISGVDEDEEAINLVKYQNSYTLASKMIQTLTEVYDRLILQTGV